MGRTQLGDEVVTTSGELPSVGTIAPTFILTGTDLKDISLTQFRGRKVVLSFFPSIETGVCAASVRAFNRIASSRKDTWVFCISRDLPFAHNRFCIAEQVGRVSLLSDFRAPEFGKEYGVVLMNGAFAGLFSRAVVIIDRDGVVAFTQLVPSIDIEPDYDDVIRNLDILP